MSIKCQEGILCFKLNNNNLNVSGQRLCMISIVQYIILHKITCNLFYAITPMKHFLCKMMQWHITKKPCHVSRAFFL